jgi:hypothetical protein
MSSAKEYDYQIIKGVKSKLMFGAWNFIVGSLPISFSFMAISLHFLATKSIALAFDSLRIGANKREFLRLQFVPSPAEHPIFWMVNQCSISIRFSRLPV